MSGKLVRVAPGVEESIHVWAGKGRPPLDMLQDLVGGYIQLWPGGVRFEGRLREAYCDEDGIAKRLRDNHAAFAKYGADILGPLVIWIPDPAPKKKEKAA